MTDEQILEKLQAILFEAFEIDRGGSAWKRICSMNSTWTASTPSIWRSNSRK